MAKYDVLKLENQICFPLYVCAKEIIRLYKPFLAELDLTYTQYITMMVLWEVKETNVKELGQRIYLDSGTLTPLLKKLESKGYIVRKRAFDDERNLDVVITEKGLNLRDLAINVPQKLSKCVNLDDSKAQALYKLLNELMFTINK